MHEVQRMIAALREIFMSKLCSIKSLVYASLIARALNRVAGNIVHFKYCEIKIFIITIINKCVERLLVVRICTVLFILYLLVETLIATF